MPVRLLREGILTSERVNALSLGAEVFYRRLMSVVDDFGRYYAKSVLLRTACFPLRVDTVKDKDIAAWLSECTEAGLILLYSDAGKHYLQLLDFRQQIRAKESKFPAPDAQLLSNCLATAHLDVDEDVDEDVDDKHSRRKAAPAPAALPEWLPVKEWNSFIDHRKALRKRMTPHAQELAIKTLEALRAAGQDIAAVLNQSIERGWQGLFEVSNGIAPPKQGAKGAAPKPDNGWMFSEQGTVAKGREFGLEARAGESWNDFRGRIHAKIRETTE